jgi:hypothetical protein
MMVLADHPYPAACFIYKTVAQFWGCDSKSGCDGVTGDSLG